jgi:pimeloyl-ACP methyl ester carboxylesterase
MADGTEALLAVLAGRQGASGVLAPQAEGETPGAGGVPIHYQVFGRGEPAVLLIPPWQIVHSRIWKLQVPYLARYGRVVTLDVRGTGRSGWPRRGYDYDTITDDIVAVLDALRIDRAAVVGHSRSGNHAVLLAHRQPARVERLVLIAPFIWLRGAPA